MQMTIGINQPGVGDDGIEAFTLVDGETQGLGFGVWGLGLRV